MLMSYPHIRMLWIIIKLNSFEDKSICYRFEMGCHFICIIMEICAGKKIPRRRYQYQQRGTVSIYNISGEREIDTGTS